MKLGSKIRKAQLPLKSLRHPSSYFVSIPAWLVFSTEFDSPDQLPIFEASRLKHQILPTSRHRFDARASKRCNWLPEAFESPNPWNK